MIELYLLNRGAMQRYEFRNKEEAMELIKSVPRLDMIKKINQKVNGMLLACKLGRDDLGEIKVQWADGLEFGGKDMVAVCDHCPLLDAQMEACRLDPSHTVRTGMIGAQYLTHSPDCTLQMIKYGDKTYKPERVENTF